MKLTLKALTRRPELKARLAGQKVLIWSGEHRCWWGPKGSGYTNRLGEAGVYLFDDAWKRSSHCGPEKKIEYHTIPPERVYSLVGLYANALAGGLDCEQVMVIRAVNSDDAEFLAYADGLDAIKRRFAGAKA